MSGKKKALSAELEAAREELGPAARGWQAALQRVPNVCPRHAIAVSRVYPSLGALMCAYERLGPGDEAGRAKLLVGLRAASVDHQGGGGGSSRSNSAMGAVVSSRLAALLWADDPEARFNDQGDEAAAD